jgi:hypothetical protein
LINSNAFSKAIPREAFNNTFFELIFSDCKYSESAAEFSKACDDLFTFL